MKSILRFRNTVTAFIFFYLLF